MSKQEKLFSINSEYFALSLFVVLVENNFIFKKSLLFIKKSSIAFSLIHLTSLNEKYFNPFLKYSANNKEQFSKDKSTKLLAPYIFKPDIYIEETKQDFIEGKDTVLNFALKHFKTQKSL